MPAAEFLEDADRPQSGRGFQHRDDFIVPDIGEGIGPASLATRLLLAGKSGILLKPVGGGRAESQSSAPAIAGEWLRRMFMNSLI